MSVFKEEHLRRAMDLTPLQQKVAEALNELSVAIATHTNKSGSGITVMVDSDIGLCLGIAPGDYNVYATAAGLVKVMSRL